MDLTGRCEPYQQAKIETILQSEHARPSCCLLIGDSLISGFDEKRYLSDYDVLNWGIEGATTQTLYLILPAVLRLCPKQIVLLIGTNDLDDAHEFDILDSTFTLFNLISSINRQLPDTKILLISPLPIREALQRTRARCNRTLRQLGEEQCKISEELKNVTYLALHEQFCDDQQELAEPYTSDGLHLNEEGYRVLGNVLLETLKKSHQ